jgi:S-phase kinase-associated protein 1
MATDAPAQKVWLASNDSATIEVGTFRDVGTAVDPFPEAPSRNKANPVFADRVVAERSMLIKNMLDDVGDEMIRQDNPIPIPNVRLHAETEAGA